MTPKSILILTTKYGGPEESPHLANELASAFRAQGHEIQVVSLEWSPKPGLGTMSYRQDDGIEALLLSPRQFSGFGLLFERITKWVGSSIFAAREADRRLGGRHFDFVFAFGPAVALHGLIRWAARRFRAPSFLYITDFFPFAGRSIGLIPAGPVFNAARRAEAALIRKFDTIGCMTPANLRFLQDHYRLRPAQRTMIMSLWGPTTPVQPADAAGIRARYGLPTATPIAIFGGQLIEGRGIEEILAVATLAKEAGTNLHFLLIGSGRRAGVVEDFIDKHPGNLTLLDSVPRDEYLTLAAACDVGLVATVSYFDGPAFPSKTIDYLRAGLPIAASVERTTDYGAFVNERQIGRAVEAGCPSRLFGAILEILSDPESRSQYRAAGRRALESYFDVEIAARRVLDEVINPPSKEIDGGEAVQIG